MPSTQVESALTNGHDDISHAGAASSKKAGSSKSKKSATKTNDEATRLLQARISQLEQDAAGEKDQELEIGESTMGQCHPERISLQGTYGGLTNMSLRARS